MRERPNFRYPFMHLDAKSKFEIKRRIVHLGVERNARREDEFVSCMQSYLWMLKISAREKKIAGQELPVHTRT